MDYFSTKEYVMGGKPGKQTPKDRRLKKNKKSVVQSGTRKVAPIRATIVPKPTKSKAQ
jgi:hypothetical protein